MHIYIYIYIYINIFYSLLYSFLIFKHFLDTTLLCLVWFSFFFLRNMHENQDKGRKMNIMMINIVHFLDMSLFCFMTESDIMLITISNVIVTAVF